MNFIVLEVERWRDFLMDYPKIAAFGDEYAYLGLFGISH